VFVLNLDQVRPVRFFEESWGSVVKLSVRQTVTVLNKGCGAGSRPNPRARPTNASPHVTVGLLQELLADGVLSPGFGIRPTPEVRDLVCKPAVHRPPRTTSASHATGLLRPGSRIGA
jgi:hypothetical protein